MGQIKNIVFEPGVVKDDTELAAARRQGKRRWTDSDRIRFVASLPQKLGGWAKYSTTTFLGVCRGIVPWQDNNSVARIGVGTHKKLYAVEAETFNNITPIRRTVTPTNPFATTSGSTTVTVTDVAHGATAGDYVQITGGSAVGGITLSGNYEVLTVSNANDLTVVHTSAATSTATGGGTPTLKYEISIGRQDGALGTGWGVGTYGSGTYGTPRSTFILLPPRTWSLGLWGQDLLAMPSGGNLYQWQRDTAVPAILVSGAPTSNGGMFVTEEKHCVVWGAGGDKMKLQWCDQDNLTQWTASDQTTAGTRALTGGSEILFGLRAQGTNLIFTDGSAWSMTFIGGLDVMGFDQIAAGASGIIGPSAAVDFNGVIFWMGQNDFYLFDGSVKPIPHSNHIRQFVFENMAAAQKRKSFCVVNTLFREICWHYATGTEINRYVKVTLDGWAWDVGSLVRTAGMDKGIYSNPILAGSDGYLWNHESGVDDDTAAMNEFIKSAPVQIGDGDQVMDILSIIPDFKDLVGNVTLTLYTREYPQKAEETVVAGTVSNTTETLDPRASGRQAAIKISGVDVGNDWRFGSMAWEIQQGGKR